MKQQFCLINDKVKRNVVNFIQSLPVDHRSPLIIEAREESRTDKHEVEVGHDDPVLQVPGARRLVAGHGDRNPRYLLVFFRDDYLEPEFRTAVPPGRPLSEVRRNGVLLAGLYELPPRGNLPSQ